MSTGTAYESSGLIQRNGEGGGGFAAPATVRPSNVVGIAAEQQRAIAEIQAALTVAQARPRDEIAAVDRIKTSCQRIRLAECAEYVYDRGGQEITGPTIDLLTVIANHWGNIQFGFRELTQSAGESSVEAFAWDLESNAKRTVVFNVPHKRVTRKGSTSLTDPRDVYELMANAAQRRVRSCLEAIIPPDVVEDALAQCKATLAETAEVTTESIEKLLAAFANLGVNKDQIQKRLGRRMEAMQPAQLVNLRRIYKSITGGLSSTGDWFEPVRDESEPAPPKTAADAAKEALKARSAPKPAAGETPPQTASVQEKPKPEAKPAPQAAKAPEQPKQARPNAEQLKGFIDLTYTDADLADFDVPAIIESCVGMPEYRKLIDAILARKHPDHTRYLKAELQHDEGGTVEDQTAPESDVNQDPGDDSGEDNGGTAAVDQDSPEFLDPKAAPRPKRMELVPTSFERKILGKRSPEELRKFVDSDIKGNPDLVDEEVAYLSHLALRRAHQLEHNIPTTDRLPK